MTQKKIFAPHLNRTVRMGRKRPLVRGPRLRLCHYLDIAKFRLPAPDCDYTKAAPDALADVLGNADLGDCTCAGVGHIVDVLCSNSGVPTRVTAGEVIALYSAACGYVIGDAATDQGGDEAAVLNYVAEKGMDGKGRHQFVGSIIVDACNKEEVRWAQWALGNLYFGEELPNGYVDPFPQGNGFVWGVAGAPVPDNGHCFIGAGSTKDGILIDTWGLIGTHTYDAAARYAVPPAFGELHSILSKEWMNTASQKTPSGFAYADLLSDLARIGAVTS
jgi:hypothetical protein